MENTVNVYMCLNCNAIAFKYVEYEKHCSEWAIDYEQNTAQFIESEYIDTIKTMCCPDCAKELKSIDIHYEKLKKFLNNFEDIPDRNLLRLTEEQCMELLL